MDPYNSLGQIKQHKFKNTSSMNISTEKEKKNPQKSTLIKLQKCLNVDIHLFIYLYFSTYIILH